MHYFMKYALICASLLVAAVVATRVYSAEPLRATQQTAVDEVDRQAEELKAVNQAIWGFAEVGLQEHKSSRLLIEKLEGAGFDVKPGVSGMPTAFVAGYMERVIR